MDLLKRYILPRLLQWLLVIIVGVTVIFFMIRMMPTDPVENMINQMNSYGQMSPAAIEKAKQTFSELYGLKGNIFEQYINFWRSILIFDLGPSFSNFPIPVMKLIGNALPWTAGLLITSLVIGWLIGIITGTISSYFSDNTLIQTLDKMIIAIAPIPFYILAMLILLLLAYIFPIFPLIGGAGIGLTPGLNWRFIASVIKHAFLPAVSMIMIGTAGRHIFQKALVSTLVSSDFVEYAQLAALSKRKIIFKYILRNSMLPQITDLALSLGAVFGGALVVEIVFSYPGMGQLLYNAIMSSDYNMIMGITIFSVIGIATSALIIDLIYPLLDPRIKYK